jgi:hypothetical protein
VSEAVYTSQLKNSNTQHTSDLNLTSYRREIMISNMYHVALLQLARHPLSYVLRAAPVHRMEIYIDRSTPDRLVHFPFFPVYIKDLHTAQNVPVHHDVRVWCLMSPSQPDGFHVLRQLQRADRSNPPRSEPLLVTVVCSCSQCASQDGNPVGGLRELDVHFAHSILRALQPKTDCMRPLSTMADKSSGQRNTPSSI